eukprot:PLAT13267.1.p1 GENE.PLAT13267.1~~PLAT13267.1.p1  ORF type:complete len:777 (+),score=272.19 PLAT13267.1:23-2332(+)
MSAVRLVRSRRASGASTRSPRRPMRSLAGATPSELLAAVEDSESEGSRFLGKLKKLERFSKRKKKADRVSRHKFQWLEELAKLNREREALEKELTATLDRAFMTKKASKLRRRKHGSGRADSAAPEGSRRPTSRWSATSDVSTIIVEEDEEEDEEDGEDTAAGGGEEDERAAALRRARGILSDVSDRGRRRSSTPDEGAVVLPEASISGEDEEEEDEDDEELLRGMLVGAMVRRDAAAAAAKSRMAGEGGEEGKRGRGNSLSTILQALAAEEAEWAIERDALGQQVMGQVAGLKALVGRMKSGDELPRDKVGEIIGDVKHGLAVLGDALADQARDLTAECERCRRRVRQAMEEASVLPLRLDVPGPEQMEEVINSLGGKDCLNEDLRINAMHDLMDVDVRNMQGLLTIREEYEAACYELGLPDSALDGSTGGWSEDDHAQFVKIHREYAAKGRHAFLERLRMQLPDKTQEQLLTHDGWWTKYRVTSRRRRDRVRAWSRERSDCMERARVAFRLDAERVRQALLHEAEVEEHEMGRMEIRARLDALREKREETKAMEREMAKRERAAERDAKRKKEAAAASMRKRNRRLLEQFKQMRVALAAAETRRVEADAVAEEIDRRRRLVRNRQRVKLRADLLREKEEEVERRRLARRAEDAERSARLQALVETTPYYDAVQFMESDPERLHRDTSASKAAKITPEERALRAKLAAFEMKGYSSEQVFKDAGFKLAMALRDAGLHTSEYASSVMRDLGARRQAPGMKASADAPWAH